MPAKKTISKEKIIDAALKIVKKRGMEGLNMRALAKECKCSTQPIYLSFGGAEELKNEVTKRIFQCYLKYREEEIGGGKYPKYKAAGMAYIRFAKYESQFFKYLFMRKRTAETVGAEDGDFDEVKNIVSSEYSLGADKALSLHTHMWIYVHGLAAMFATGYLDWDMDLVSEMLTEEFLAIKYRLV